MASERSSKNVTAKITIHQIEVNTPAPYELLIAEKLQQIPVPDMMDSIWANIEQQLDAGLPGGEEDNTPNPAPKGGGNGAGASAGKLFLYAVIAVTAGVIIYLNTKNRNQTSKQHNTPSVIINKPSVTDSSKTSLLPPTVIQPEKEPPLIRNTPIKINPDTPALFILPSLKRLDSLLTVPPEDIVPDTINKIKISPLDSQQLQPPKKSRGVKGILNDDYKLQVSKDSTKKKGG